MRKPGGYAYSFDALGIRKEYDTFTCFHCKRVIHVKPKMDPTELGGMCKLCMKMICPKCVGFSCTPFEKQLDIMEARDRARRSYGM